MAYKALYRSYRPTTFKEVIGQKHVIQTLKNAISEKRTSHAYVFSGLRGIGKTTIARILAKAVNCENPVDGEPCNVCANCKSISNNETTDIIELDAASNNGVDEIRGLLEKVNFLPSVLNKKVYIIDEVHMLSTAAFNALLKTLEEPPAYTMFILATTEPHKIPMTILSRCQRFDFKQLTIEELTEELTYICEKENIKISEDALNGIAEAAEGGMRDALSILDQASVYASSEVSINDVNSVTGNISNQKLIELVNAFNNDDATGAIKILNELLNMGKEVSRFTTCIIQFCRDLLLYKSVNDAPGDKYIYTTQEFKTLAEETDSKRLFYYIDVLVDVQNKIRFTNSQKIYLEVGIMKIVNSATEDIDVLGRIQNLEAMIASGGGIEYSGNFISSPNVEQRLNTLENKLKKLNNEIEKVNIVGFEEKINSKVNVLEEVTSRISALPNTIEERINILENRMTDIELISSGEENVSTIDTNNHTNVDYENRLIQLEQEIKETSTKNNAVLNAIVEDIDHLKSDSSLKEGINNDDVILELIEKVTEIENMIGQNSPVVSNEQDINGHKIDEIVNNINVVTTNLNQLKNKVDSIYQKGFAEISFDSIFDNQPEQNNNNEVLEVVNELLNDFNNLKEEVSLIKGNQQQNSINEVQNFSLYNKDREEQQDDSQIMDNLEKINLRVESLEKVVSEQKDTSLVNAISEIKTNYFVLTQALTLMKEKMDHLTQGVPSENIDLSEIESKIIAIAEEVNELKEQKVDKEEVSLLLSKVENINVNEIESKVIDSGLKAIQEKLNELKDLPKQEPVKEEVVKVEAIKEENNNVVLEEVKEEIKENIIQEVKVEKQEEDLTSKIFDIRIIENVLHESRTPECRALKPQLVANWYKLEEKAGGTLAPIARLLTNGLLVANGNTHLLIVYPNAQLCNFIMDPKNYKDAKEIIQVTFNKEFDFIALPDDTWKEKRLEYHNQFRIGDIYPKLTPINNPKLRIVVVKSEPILSEREKMLKRANEELFGDDE